MGMFDCMLYDLLQRCHRNPIAGREVDAAFAGLDPGVFFTV